MQKEHIDCQYELIMEQTPGYFRLQENEIPQKGDFIKKAELILSTGIVFAALSLAPTPVSAANLEASQPRECTSLRTIDHSSGRGEKEISGTENGIEVKKGCRYNAKVLVSSPVYKDAGLSVKSGRNVIAGELANERYCTRPKKGRAHVACYIAGARGEVGYVDQWAVTTHCTE